MKDFEQISGILTITTHFVIFQSYEQKKVQLTIPYFEIVDMKFINDSDNDISENDEENDYKISSVEIETVFMKVFNDQINIVQTIFNYIIIKSIISK